MIFEIFFAVVTIVFGLLVIALPRLLRYIVGLYFIITGLISLATLLL